MMMMMSLVLVFGGVAALQQHHQRLPQQGRRGVTMLDTSSSMWRGGDRVRVCESVIARGRDLRGFEGVVVDAWEKCAVDPHCCCAELADEDVAVTVQFRDESVYYFADGELERVRTSPRATAAAAAIVAATVAPGAASAVGFPPEAVDPLMASPLADEKVTALLLVFPLLAYKAAALANREQLILPLDAAICLAVVSALTYVAR